MKIAISTNKGGCLKTTTAVSLASIYARENKVLVVDCDSQGNASLAFGMNPDRFQRSIYDVLVNDLHPEHALANVSENLDILPANEQLQELEFEVFSNAKKYPEPFYLLRETLQPLVAMYDYIFIDTPPNIGLMTWNVLSFTDGVIIPFQPENFSMRSFIKMLNEVRKFQEQHNASLEVTGVIGTLVDKRTVLHREIVAQCRDYCKQHNIPMFDTIVPRSIEFANSIAYYQQPAAMAKPKSSATAVYESIRREIHE